MPSYLGRVAIPLAAIFSSIYTRRPSKCRGVGYTHSPESLTSVSSSGFARLPPTCISKFLGYSLPDAH
jgi:hypothetical protein